MITINLLPPEHRKKERTPLVLFLPILGGVACVLSAAALAIYVHFAWLAETVSHREQLEQTLASKQPLLRYETSLLAEEAEFKKRADTISSIASGRILLTRIVDEFADVVADGDTLGDDGYLIRLSSLTISPPKAAARRGKDAGPKSGGEVSINGWALADRDPLHEFNLFHERLQMSRTFVENYNEITDPDGRIDHFADEKIPSKGWTIKQTLSMKDPADSMKARESNQLAEKSGK
ncbi:MAG: hypothetical protein KDB53_14985 [Planctomycetes bacterium]|nr:hypothetical protein [Planctomycetota bacterium]